VESIIAAQTKRVYSPTSKAVSIIAGFLDGSFNASNTSYCTAYLKLFGGSIVNYTESTGDLNEEVWYGTRVLKYFHPTGFHCYYTYQETDIAIMEYLQLNSVGDILHNLIYKTGLMFNNIRIIWKIINIGEYEDRDWYVIFQSIGALVYIIFTP
jgi:hypothetical protein